MTAADYLQAAFLVIGALSPFVLVSAIIAYSDDLIRLIQRSVIMSRQRKDY